MTLQEFLAKNDEDAMLRAKRCHNIVEFKELAKDLGIEMSEAEIESSFDLLCSPEMVPLEDDELDAVAGGGKNGVSSDEKACPKYKGPVGSGATCSTCEHFHSIWAGGTDYSTCNRFMSEDEFRHRHTPYPSVNPTITLP